MNLSHIITANIDTNDTAEEIADLKAHYEQQHTARGTGYGITWYTIHTGATIELTNEAPVNGFASHRQITRTWLDGEQPDNLWAGAEPITELIAVPHFFYNEETEMHQPTTLADVRHALSIYATI